MQQPMQRLKNEEPVTRCVNKQCFLGRIHALLPFPPSAHQYLPLPWECSSLRESLHAAEPPLANVPCHLRGVLPVLTSVEQEPRPFSGTQAVQETAALASAHLSRARCVLRCCGRLYMNCLGLGEFNSSEFQMNAHLDILRIESDTFS